MKRNLAKKLDYILNVIYNMRVYGVMPSQKDEPIYRKVLPILNQDGMLMESYRGVEITEKGLAFMEKGGYTALWYKDILRIFVVPFATVVIGVLLTWLLH